MKQIVAVIKPFLTERVVRALSEAPIDEILIREVKGFGRQKNYLDLYGENEYSQVFLPKIEINVWTSDEAAESVVNRIVEASRTGRIGDGKLFVLPVERLVHDESYEF